MFAIKVVKKNGDVVFVNNPAVIYFSPTTKPLSTDNPGYIKIYSNGRDETVIFQDNLITPIKETYAEIEDAFLGGRLITIKFDG